MIAVAIVVVICITVYAIVKLINDHERRMFDARQKLALEAEERRERTKL